METISETVTAVDMSDAIDPQQNFQSHQYYRIFLAVRDDIVVVLARERQDKIAFRDRTDTQRYRLQGPPGGDQAHAESRAAGGPRGLANSHEQGSFLRHDHH
jgi:esterase/lipase superfamily enzyme